MSFTSRIALTSLLFSPTVTPSSRFSSGARVVISGLKSRPTSISVCAEGNVIEPPLGANSPK